MHYTRNIELSTCALFLRLVFFCLGWVTWWPSAAPAVCLVSRMFDRLLSVWAKVLRCPQVLMEGSWLGMESANSLVLKSVCIAPLILTIQIRNMQKGTVADPNTLGRILYICQRVFRIYVRTSGSICEEMFWCRDTRHQRSGYSHVAQWCVV